MQDEFVNRLGMFRTALGTHNRPEHQSVQQNQPPAIFATKVAVAQQAVDEEAELEQEAYVFGGALAIRFLDQGNEENAAKVDLPLSGWRRLRDQQLLEKAKLVHQLGESVTSGPNAATATDHGITPDSLAKLKKETDDYDAVITAPQQAIAERKARTRQLRDRFNAVESQFQTLDRMVQLFRATPAGQDLIAAWQASRVTRDLGRGPSQPPVEDPTPSS